jgi:hypothetical protein
MYRPLSRRDFLKISGLSLAALAFDAFPYKTTFWSPGELPYKQMTGRVAKRFVYLHDQPDLESPRIEKIPRDSILPLSAEVNSKHAPQINPRWYQLEGGFVHSAYIQRVEKAHLNRPLAAIPESGRLGEITVPYTQTMFKDRQGYWMKLYRLYYQSVHWLTGIVESPEGETWYQITDERLKVQYYLPVEHVRPLLDAEMAPISSAVPDRLKRIEVSLDEQRLTAYEGDRVVLQSRISSGQRYMETPRGDFFVQRKYPSRHMGDGWLTSSIDAYELVGVPWVTFFHKAGIAFHGTYWHDNFGEKMSHGCVNMRNQDAKWLFRWCSPAFDPAVSGRSAWKLVADGTSVVVY